MRAFMALGVAGPIGFSAMGAEQCASFIVAAMAITTAANAVQWPFRMARRNSFSELAPNGWVYTKYPNTKLKI
jgi:hypothetical protein